MSNFQPLEDYILVEPDQIETVTSAGIVLPSSAQETPSTGVVKACGPGRFESGIFVPMNVEVGDRILFHRGHLFVVESHSETYTLLKATSVIGRL
jgi:chaperonin GroES